MQIGKVNVYLSTNDGESWTKLNATGGSIGAIEDPDVWGNCPYVPSQSDVSDLCLVKVESYNDPSISQVSPSTFTITATAVRDIAGARRLEASVRALVGASRTWQTAISPSAARFDQRGREIPFEHTRGGRPACGVYLAR